MADWDVVGQAPAQLQNPWAVKSNAPAPAPDAIGEANKAAEQSEHGPVQDVIDMLHSAATSIGPQIKALVTKGIDPDAAIDQVAHGLRTFLQNPETATPQVVGQNVVAPALLGEAGGLLGRGAEAAITPAAEAGPAAQLGLRTAGGIPAKMAGNTAGPVLDAQNNRVASSVLGADVGVPHSSPVTPQTLAAAREAPGQVLDAGYSQIQPGPLSPAAQAQVTAARGPATITKPTPNVTNQINGIESSLLDPNGQFTGEQLRATRNSLSSDANAGRNSADADTRAVAQYKANVVNALDQHLADSLPPGGTVTPDMVQNARATLAKNYQLQDLLTKGGDVDLQALAKLHRDSPNLLTGNTRTVAQFASDHPEVTGAISDANRISPPSFLSDVAGINPLKPLGTFGQAMFGTAGRRLLTGAPGEAIGSAMQAPVAGLADEFTPRQPGPLSLQPPPGRAIEPYQPDLATGNPDQSLAPRPPAELAPPPGQALEPAQRRLFGDQPLADAFPSGPGGISAAPIKLGNVIPGQRGAIGAPTDIGGIRRLMNEPRTYTGMKPEELAALEDALQKLQQQPRTYAGTTPLDREF